MRRRKASGLKYVSYKFFQEDTQKVSLHNYKKKKKENLTDSSNEKILFILNNNNFLKEKENILLRLYYGFPLRFKRFSYNIEKLSYWGKKYCFCLFS